jgi:hypothetical protein
VGTLTLASNAVTSVSPFAEIADPILGRGRDSLQLIEPVGLLLGTARNKLQVNSCRNAGKRQLSLPVSRCRSAASGGRAWRLLFWRRHKLASNGEGEIGGDQ